VVSFTLRPLYLTGKSPRYPLDRRLGWSQSRSGRGGGEKNSQSLPRLEPQINHPVAQRYTTGLSRFLQENHELESNGIYQLPIYAVDIDLLCENTNSKPCDTENLLDANKEVGIEVRVRKTETYVHVLSPERKTKSRYKHIIGKCGKVKYFTMTVRNQNYIHEKTKSLEQIKLEECFLPFSSGSFIYPSPT
jgi:hypothetical protein